MIFGVFYFYKIVLFKRGGFYRLILLARGKNPFENIGQGR